MAEKDDAVVASIEGRLRLHPLPQITNVAQADLCAELRRRRRELEPRPGVVELRRVPRPWVRHKVPEGGASIKPFTFRTEPRKDD